MKICTSCGVAKEIEEFHRDRTTTDGRYPICKECKNTKHRRYYLANTEKEIARVMRSRKKHLEKYTQTIAKWRVANRKRINDNQNRRYAENPEKIRAYARKVISSLKGKLNNTIKSRIGKGLRGSKKGQHWEDLVGFTVEQLKGHLEKMFTPEMNWDNYGTVWEIDHKIPIAIFNYERPEDIDFRICWSLNNLQPLNYSENRSKRDKIDKPFQPSLALNMGG